MGMFFYLASEGFGLNLNIIDTNLVNLTILVGLLVVYGRKFLNNILTTRQAKIAEEIKEAENRAQEAATALAEAQQQLAQAQAEAEKIRNQAQERAQALKESIISRGKADVQRMQETATQELNTETEKVIAELKERIAVLAIAKAEAGLKDSLNSTAQSELINRSIAKLGGRG